MDRELNTSSRLFEFVFRMFSMGSAVSPADGMGAIPHQLAAPLSDVRLGAPVTDVSAKNVRLADGNTMTGQAVIVAAGATESQQLLEE